MKTKSNHVFRRSVVASALIAAFGGAFAADGDIAEYTKPDSSISLGVGNWSADRRQQGQYDGMRDSGAYGLADINIAKRNDETGAWFTATGRNLGLDSRDLSIDYLRQGDIGLGFDYSRTTRDNPLEIHSGLQGKGQTQSVVTVAPGGGANLNLGVTRDATGVRFFKNLMNGLDFTASFKNEEKNGSRNWGRGGAAEFAIEPIDSTTRQFDARLDYTSDKLQLAGGYYGSWYENHNSLVTSTFVAGNNAYILSLPLDNQAHQVYLEGGYSFTPTTRGTFKASYGRATQDENIPTRTLIGVPNFSFAGAPYSLNGKVDTTLLQLGLTSRPIKDLSLVANLRYHDLDDKTPERLFIQTNAACGAGQCIENTPFSYRTISGKLEATYRLPDGYSLIGGVDRKDQKRSIPVGNYNASGVDLQRVVPMRSNLDETTYRLEARKSMSETVNGSISYLTTDRDGSTYKRAGAGSGGAAADNVNPINIADRTRDKWRLGLDWTPIEKLSMQFAFEDATDNYDTKANRPYGLIDGNASIYTFDANYSLNDDWSVSAWYSRDNTKAKQKYGADLTTAANIRTATLREAGDSIGLGVRGKLYSRLSMGADLQYSKTHSEYPQVSNSGVENNLSDIDNRLVRFSIFAKYALEKNSDVLFSFIHERWKTDDWTWQFSNGSPFTYGSTTDGTTVYTDKKQTANFLGLRYVYKFQ